MSDNFLWSVISLIGIIMLSTFIAGYLVGSGNVKSEAFDRGFMIKEVTRHDEIIYKWKESK